MELIEKLFETKDSSDLELQNLIQNGVYEKELFQKADSVRRSVYGRDVYIRGLIEISNYCKNDCFYCGIRRGNANAERYRLTSDEILSCCDKGYELGFRTFVLQGGEDDYYSDEMICGIVSRIKESHPDCAVTLSLGEKTFDSYKAYYSAGADRYLLRHETADAIHYRKLHPPDMSLDNRKRCLQNLKEIGYQTGSGFMVGSPFQAIEYIIKDLRFLQSLQPDMIGIGPYLSHANTPFHNYENGSLSTCLRIIAILRLMFPHALIPATTALGTVADNGRELGLSVGANVVMPNLSPVKTRKLYELYDNKLSTGEEASEHLSLLAHRIESIGYRIVTDIGNVKK